MEPKYVLVMRKGSSKNNMNPYAIYEQAVIGGQVGQRIHSTFDKLEEALEYLVELNGGEPVLLAYSTKPIDNTFTI